MTTINEEMLDTFDINGKFLGVKTRTECHTENAGFYHKSAWVWIINDKGEILVQKRAHTKKKSPDKWDMPAAGHLDAGKQRCNVVLEKHLRNLELRQMKKILSLSKKE